MLELIQLKTSHTEVNFEANNQLNWYAMNIQMIVWHFYRSSNDSKR